LSLWDFKESETAIELSGFKYNKGAFKLLLVSDEISVSPFQHSRKVGNTATG